MQRIMSKNNLISSPTEYGGKIIVCHPGMTDFGIDAIPKKNPINAKGNAKMVCENLTRER